MFEQKTSVRSASFADFDERWTRAMIKSEWKLQDGTEALLEIEAFDDMLSKTTAENNELISVCLAFIKAADFEKDGWISFLSDCEAYNCHRLHGIKHSYPKHVVAISFKASSTLGSDDVLAKIF